MSQEEKRREARIQELEQEIADLKARWPKHSVPPAMLMRLEELEEELEQLSYNGQRANPNPRPNNATASKPSAR
jgi:hypothetical protein